MKKLILATFFLTMTSVYASTEVTWPSAERLFARKEWKIVSYSRVCSEYDKDLEIKRYDCSLLDVKKKIKEKNSYISYFAALNISPFDSSPGYYGDIPPQLELIRSYALDDRLIFVDQSVFPRGNYGYNKTEGHVLNESFGNIFLRNPAVKTSWSEACANSKSSSCLLLELTLQDDEQRYVDPTSSGCRPGWACIGNEIHQAATSRLTREPKNNTYTFQSEITLTTRKDAFSYKDIKWTTTKVETNFVIQGAE